MGSPSTKSCRYRKLYPGSMENGWAKCGSWQALWGRRALKLPGRHQEEFEGQVDEVRWRTWDL